MKNRLCRASAAFGLACMIVLLMDGVAGAQTNFAFNIVGRGVSSSPPLTGPFPTGMFKMTLETAGPVAGATVAVGSGSCSIPGTGDCHYITSNGDRVSAMQDTNNPNNAVIEYYPLSQFASSGNFCNPSAPQSVTTTLETVTMTFTGPTINGYRQNSYTVASTLDCSQPYVRIDSNPVVFSQAPSGATFLGRNPLDVVLVLDNSGSMSLPSASPTPAAPWDTRWDVLNQVVQMFLEDWAQTTGTPENASPEDRVGLVFYSTTAEPASFPAPAGAGIFESRQTSATPWTTVATAVQNQGPTNSTAIGLGLIEAICDARFGPNASTNDVQLVLMTDGEQNVVPLLQPDPPMEGTITLDFSSAPGACASGVTNIYSYHTAIHSVALGVPATIDTQLLSSISTQTGGQAYEAPTAETTTETFLDTFMEVLKGNTLDLNIRTEGSLDASIQSSAALPLLLDSSIKRTTMVLGWENQANGLDLQITSPNGTVVTPVARRYTPFWTVQSIDMPASGPAGAWSVKVVRNPKGAPYRDTQTASTPYFLSVYSVEGSLGYKFSFSTGVPGTGNPIGLKVDVSYNGKPLTGLGNSIKVQIERPNAGLGTILYNSSVPGSVLSTQSGPDVTTPYQRKVAYLAGSTNLVGTLTPQPIPNQYFLLDDGNTAQDGDLTANDGTYSTIFPDTSTPGLYIFKVSMDWNNATTGSIHREETLQIQVQVNPDPVASDVKTANAGSPGAWTINVIPIDKFRNYLGPGYAPAFQVQTSAGIISGPPSDENQTGAYTINLTGVPAGVDPVVSIKVGGIQIRNGKLSTLGSANGRECMGLHFGFVLLPIPTGIMLLGILVYWPRRKKGV